MTCAKEDGVPVDVVMHNGMIEARKKSILPVNCFQRRSDHVEQSRNPTRQALLKTGRIDDAFDWLVSMMAPEA